jgi:hypothetical protein
MRNTIHLRFNKKAEIVEELRAAKRTFDGQQ